MSFSGCTAEKRKPLPGRAHSGARRGQGVWSIRNGYSATSTAMRSPEPDSGLSIPAAVPPECEPGNETKKRASIMVVLVTDGSKGKALSMGKLRRWFESLSDVELGRVADATAWNHSRPFQHGTQYSHDQPGCLICHATGNVGGAGRYGSHGLANRHANAAENRYIRLSLRRGPEKVGKLMQAMARGVIARRTLNAMPSLPTASVTPKEHATV